MQLIIWTGLGMWTIGSIVSFINYMNQTPFDYIATATKREFNAYLLTCLLIAAYKPFDFKNYEEDS